MEATDLPPGELVHIVDIDKSVGAAAHLVHPGGYARGPGGGAGEPHALLEPLEVAPSLVVEEPPLSGSPLQPCSKELEHGDSPGLTVGGEWRGGLALFDGCGPEE
ncbi:hypothetical protein [Streptomyces sp. C3-3]|uniref:hypothetical protein n=1 Tax=Streptomyces sp. C3-3 TaxID=2824901 RepID=UPI0035AFE0AC